MKAFILRQKIEKQIAQLVEVKNQLASMETDKEIKIEISDGQNQVCIDNDIDFVSSILDTDVKMNNHSLVYTFPN